MSAPLHLEGIDAHYGDTRVLEALSLEVAGGELVSLLGASGCGKTTTLRLVAGFLQPSAGSIRLGDRDLRALPAHARDIGLVFQTYALFPHLTVRDNVAFGLKQRGIKRAERRKQAARMIERVGLEGFEERRPADLSGGQRQRVALARALVIEPPLLMFDEPLSNLDARLRVDMRVEIRRLQQASGATSLYVTHDQEEAFSISDRVAIMHDGQIMQLDTPEVLYSRPANAFVADFVGFENRIPLSRSSDSASAILPDGTAMILPFPIEAVPADDFMLAARAEGLEVSPDDSSVDGMTAGIPATLGMRTYLGRAYQYRCQSCVGELVANGPLSTPFEPGTRVTLNLRAEHCCLLQREDS